MLAIRGHATPATDSNLLRRARPARRRRARAAAADAPGARARRPVRAARRAGARPPAGGDPARRARRRGRRSRSSRPRPGWPSLLGAVLGLVRLPGRAARCCTAGRRGPLPLPTDVLPAPWVLVPRSCRPAGRRGRGRRAAAAPGRGHARSASCAGRRAPRAAPVAGAADRARRCRVRALRARSTTARASSRPGCCSLLGGRVGDDRRRARHRLAVVSRPGACCTASPAGRPRCSPRAG